MSMMVSYMLIDLRLARIRSERYQTLAAEMEKAQEIRGCLLGLCSLSDCFREVMPPTKLENLTYGGSQGSVSSGMQSDRITSKSLDH